jgi:serine phosphatase RsbU (regulator of sigma subunit)/serine/threonine protein kinase/tetratricopeptide (TPR) repeat protein
MSEDIRIGEVLDSRYQLKKLLGGGRVGKVYLARDGKNECDVAIKILSQHPYLDREKILFDREFAAIKTLNHPGVVKVYEAGDGYFVMEYVDGVPLSKYKGDDIAQIFDIGIDITRVLEYIHRQGVIHRDLKPENIKITPNRVVKILDFGFAIGSDVANLISSGHTEIVGTLNYMAPEVIKGFEIDPRADLYSLGIILYELVTQRLPFQSSDILTTVLRQVEMTPPLPSEFNAKITPGFETIIMKLIAKSPAKRFQSAEELMSAMMKLAGRSEILKIKVDRGRKFLYPPKFVGREAELNRISTICKKAMKGRGYFVLIRGEEGIGKTRLIREFMGQNRSEDVIFLEITCSSSMASFNTFSQMIYEVFRILETAQEAYLNELASRWGPILLPFSPALGHKNYMRSIVPHASIGDDTLRHQLCQFFIEVSKKHPLGIFIDDLHWLDQDSCYLLLDLVQEAQEHSVFLCGTYQPSLQTGESIFQKILPRLKLKKICEEIELKPLACEEVSPMLGSMVAQEKLDGEVLNKVYEVSRGVPLLAEETMKNMADDGLVYRQGGVWFVAVDDVRKIRRPSLLEDSLIEKYEQLDLESALILQIAAVIAHRFPRFILEKICGLSDATLMELLAPLQKQGFISEMQEGIQTYTAIGSLRLAELIYEKMLAKTRSKLHEEVAKVLESLPSAEDHIEDMARHYYQARQYRKAAYYLVSAGQIAERHYNYTSAIQYYQQALEICTQRETGDIQVVEILHKLGHIHSRAGQHDMALKYYQRGLDMAQELQQSADELHKGIGTVYFNKGQFSDALQHFQILLDSLRAHSQSIAQELTLAASVHIAMGSYDEADKLLREALSQVKREDRKDLQASIYRFCAEIHFMRGHWENAMSYYRRGINLSHTTGDQYLKAQVAHGMARLYLQRGQTKEAYKYLEDALYFCHLTGDREMRVMVEIGLGLLFEQDGDLNRAMEIYRENLETAQDFQMKQAEGYAGMYLGHALNLYEKNHDAIDCLVRSMAIFQKLQAISAVGECFLNMGKVYTDQGEYQEALKAFTSGEQTLRAVHVKWKVADIYAGMAAVMQKNGDMENANKTLNRALKLAKKYDDRILLGRIHTQYALFCANSHLNKEAIEHFVCAIVFLEEMASALDLARTYYEYGKALLEFERRGDYGFIKVAVHQLEKAREIYRKAGLQAAMNKTVHLIKECERQKSDIVYKRDLVVKLREFGREISDFGRDSAQQVEALKKKVLDEIGNEMDRESVLAEIEKRIAEVNGSLNKRLDELQTQNNGLLTQVEELKAERESLLTLQKISNTINSVLDLEKLLKIIMDMVVQELRAERGFIVLTSEDKEGFTVKAARNIEKEEVSHEESNLSRSVVKKVIRTGEPVLTSDAQADGRFQSQSIMDLKLRSILCVPFKLRDRVIGAVYVDNRFVSGLFTERDMDFLVAFSSQAAIAIENAFLYEELTEKQRMEQELNIAARIQAGLLPKTLPEVAGLEVYGKMMPAREVGGDYYDFIVDADNEGLSLVIGDVSGKGIPAGLVMVMARLILHHFLRDNKASTKETLLATNRLLKDNTEPFIFMSLLLAHWDSKNSKFVYTGAGHENLIICRAKDKNLEVIPAGGVVLGVKDDIKEYLEEKELSLQPGDEVIFYTDGVTECLPKSGQMLELNGFLEMIRKHAGKAPQEMVQSLIVELKEFMGDQEQHDDITLTVIQRK